MGGGEGEGVGWGERGDGEGEWRDRREDMECNTHIMQLLMPSEH